MLETTHKDIKNAVIKSQHTQRNWDLTREVPDDDIQTLIHAVQNCPSKQNFAFYKAHFITNRDIIEQLHEASMGLGYADPETGERVECTNPQVLANLVVVFEEAEMSDEYWKKWNDNDFSREDLHRRDLDTAIGIAAGYVNVIGTMLGMQTGCCACYDVPKVKEILGLKKDPILLMGVGYKDPNRQRREHHTENVMIKRRVKEDIEVNIIR
jgi:nitroreductase